MEIINYQTPPQPMLEQADAAWVARIRRGVLGLMLGSFAHRLFWESLRWLRIGFRPLDSFSIAGWNSILQLSWPVLLLPGALLLCRPEKPGESARWPGLGFLIFLVAHLLFLFTAIGIRIRWWGGWNSAYLFCSDLEPAFFVPEIWLMLRTVENLAARIPGRPMTTETPVLRRIFCLVLLLQVVGEIFDWFFFRRIWGYFPNRFGDLLGQVIPAVTFPLLNTATLCLRPLWLYLPVFLLRFNLHVRRASIS